MTEESRHPETTALVPDPLPTLASSIHEEHLACIEAARNSVEHARRCGELLIQAKTQVAHGEWGAWVEAHCGFADRTARMYMQIARRWPMLDEAIRQRVAEMSVRHAVEAIRYEQRTPLLPVEQTPPANETDVGGPETDVGGPARVA